MTNDHTTMTTSAPFPTLHTPRLQLVAPEARHFKAFAELHADPGTMEFVATGMPFDPMTSWVQLALLSGHWDLRGYGVWIVEDRVTRDFVGRVGFFHPEGWDEPELSWIITPSMRGHGVATEAARAALDYAFDVLGFETVISMIVPKNLASKRVATKVGGVQAETTVFLGDEMQVYRYHRGG